MLGLKPIHIRAGAPYDIYDMVNEATKTPTALTLV